MPRSPLCALALVALGCGSKNEVGFWDIASVSVTAAGQTQEQLDFGTLEFTEQQAIFAVFRYDLLDPATVQAGAQAEAGDTGASGAAGDWMPPLRRPVLVTGSFDDNDHTIEYLFIGTMNLAGAEMTRYRGTEITYEASEGIIGTTPIEALVIELTR